MPISSTTASVHHPSPTPPPPPSCSHLFAWLSSRFHGIQQQRVQPQGIGIPTFRGNAYSIYQLFIRILPFRHLHDRHTFTVYSHRTIMLTPRIPYKSSCGVSPFPSGHVQPWFCPPRMSLTLRLRAPRPRHHTFRSSYWL